MTKIKMINLDKLVLTSLLLVHLLCCYHLLLHHHPRFHLGSNSTFTILFAKLAAIHHPCFALFMKLINDYQEDSFLSTVNVQDKV
jgi:hypothetical protein